MKNLIWICLMLFAALSFGQSATASLEEQEIKIGEQTSITIELRLPAGEDNIIFPALQDTISKFVEIVSVSNIDTTFDEEDIGIKIFTQTLQITSWDSGYHALPPFLFSINREPLYSNAGILHVIAVPVNTEEDIKDIKDIIEVPFSLWDWILSNRKLILSILLLVALLIVAYFIIKKYFLNKAEDGEEQAPLIPAHVIAHDKLQDLKAKNLWQNGETKAYHSELTFILREYLELAYQIPALEMSSSETTALIKTLQLSDKKWIEQIDFILNIADMAKFAKQNPLSNENEEAWKITHDFVDWSAKEIEKKEQEKATQVQAIEKPIEE